MQTSKFKVGDRVYFQDSNSHTNPFNGCQGVVKSPLQTFRIRYQNSGRTLLGDGHVVEWATGEKTCEPADSLRLIKPDQDEDMEISQETINLLNNIKNREPVPA